VTWKTINGRRVNVRSGRRKGYRPPARRDGLRFIFGSSKTPAERARLDRQKARKAQTKAELKNEKLRGRLAVTKAKAARRQAKAELAALNAQEKLKKARDRAAAPPRHGFFHRREPAPSSTTAPSPEGPEE